VVRNESNKSGNQYEQYTRDNIVSKNQVSLPDTAQWRFSFESRDSTRERQCDRRSQRGWLQYGRWSRLQLQLQAVTKVRHGKNVVNHEPGVSNVFIANRVWCDSRQNVKVRPTGCIQRTRNRRDRRKDSHAGI
jgi:hypothetical protein